MVMSSLYFSAVAASFLMPRIASALFFSSGTNNAVESSIVESGKNLAYSLGYSDIFRPHSFHYNYELREIEAENNYVVVGGFPNQQAYVCNEGYGAISDDLDRMGFRNSDSVWENLDDIEIMLIGDSMVFGECVERKDNISERLIFKGFPTLNLGIGANSTGEYALTQQIFLPHVRPRYLVTVIYPNDKGMIDKNVFFDYLKNHEFIENYVVKNGDSLRLSAQTEGVYRQIEDLDLGGDKRLEKNLFFKFLYNFFGSRHWRLDGVKPFIVEASNLGMAELDLGTRMVFDLAIKNCEKYNCDPIFVYIPNDLIFDKDQQAKYYLSNIKDHLGQQDAFFIDTSAVIHANKEATYSRHSGHLSPYGYSLVGDAILTKIIQIKNTQYIK